MAYMLLIMFYSSLLQVAVSTTHTIVVTYERDVYTWGDGKLGELGHGDLNSRYHPEVVQALKGKSITK